MLERLQPTLALLDQGLSLYRRHFASFVLIAAIWFVPVAILFGLAVAFGSQLDSGLGILLLLVGVVVLFVLMIYLITALSRAAGAALEGQPMRLGSLLRFEPLRLFGMTVFSIIYLIGAQIASSTVSLVCICPAYIFGVAVIGGLAAVGGESFGVGGILLVALIFALVYAIGLFVSGAVYGGMVYGLQPWVQENNRFGVAFQRALELMFYRFWRNLVVWGFASIILAAAGLAVTIAIGVALPLPLAWAFGTETPAVQAVTAGAWLVGLVVVLPPLPIWMTMLYRQNRTAREGTELQAKVEAWWKQHFSQVQNSEFRV